MDLAFVDRSGEAVPLGLSPGQYEAPRVSPDGMRVAFVSVDGTDVSVWIYELSGASAMRKLTLAGRNRYPVWAPDSQRVAFQSDREGDLGIFWQRADGTGAVERLTTPDAGISHAPESWSRSGETLMFSATKDARARPSLGKPWTPRSRPTGAGSPTTRPMPQVEAPTSTSSRFPAQASATWPRRTWRGTRSGLPPATELLFSPPRI